MKIKDPMARYGDSVMVLNYRCKPARWDEGECASASYSDTHGVWSWQYSVRINRGKIFFLYVGDNGIKRV